MMRDDRIREGIVAGALGASVVALWFFVVDLIAHQPLHTPLLLADALYKVFGTTIGSATTLPIVAYTVVHYVVFIVTGLAVAATLNASHRSPGVLAGLFLLFAVFEVGFYFLCVTLSMLDVVGSLAWYQIGAANILASVVMGTYLWRRHPETAHEMNAALKGTTN